MKKIAFSLKILYLKKSGDFLTGSGTYRDLLLEEITKHHQIKIYDSPADLDEQWDLAHALDIKHFPVEVIKRLNCPLIVDIHDHYWVDFYPFFCPDLPLRFFLQKYRRVKYKRILKSTEAVIAHSKCVLEAIKHPRKFLVNYGIDSEAFKSSEYGDSSKDVILFVGRDYFRKGILTLFRALPLLLKEIPTTKIIIVGKEFWHSRVIARLISYNLPVEFINGLTRDQLMKYYQKARVFVLPSKVEAFGISILEALAAGVPVVASKVGGITEIISHGKTGLAFERGDFRELAHMVGLCLRDNEIRETLIKNGAKVIKENFTIKEMVEEINSVYSKVK
ncbi:MAG: glycosyltransferase family 4 protein [Deltaproteobacteria bacterium]|nr:MAG: glycosyltransferase family 4 protein [Deltaproteobacteria bacterium]